MDTTAVHDSKNSTLVPVLGLSFFAVASGLLMLAVLPPLLIKSGQPEKKAQEKMRISEITKLSRPAIIGCLISGLLESQSLLLIGVSYLV